MQESKIKSIFQLTLAILLISAMTLCGLLWVRTEVVNQRGQLQKLLDAPAECLFGLQVEDACGPMELVVESVAAELGLFGKVFFVGELDVAEQAQGGAVLASDRIVLGAAIGGDIDELDRAEVDLQPVGYAPLQHLRQRLEADRSRAT